MEKFRKVLFGMVAKIANIKSYKHKLTSELNDRQRHKLSEISKTSPAKAIKGLIFRKTEKQ